MLFVPRRLHGLVVGISISLGLLALAGVFGWRLSQTPISITSFLLGAAGALALFAVIPFAYWTFACWRLRYALDSSSLTIRWGGVRHVLPLNFIERAVSGDEVERNPHIRGLNWMGYHVGSAKLGAIGPVVFCSTHSSPGDVVYLVTPGLSYGISPPNPRSFMAKLNDLKQQYTGPQMRPKVDRWFVLRLPIWRDRYAQVILMAGLAINLALFAYVSYFYPSLPELLPMHFTVFGEVDLIGFRAEVLKLPVMAFVVFAVNLLFGVALHAKERLAAYLCIVAAVFVQVVFWVATTRIVY